MYTINSVKRKQKTMKQQRLSRLSQQLRTTLVLVLALALVAAGVGLPRLVYAEPTLQEQIRILQEENNANKSAVANLLAQATGYQNAIDQLQGQINQLQAQINQNEAEKASLERQIIELQQQLEQQKDVLGENIKAMYVGDTMSTIEMLATSKNLSEFVDKSAYRNAVQRKVQDTLARITALQNELGTKKSQIEILLESLQSQRATVDTARAEQANLLAMNQQQQADFNAKTQSNQAKINQLNAQIAAQARANSIRPDGGYYFLRFPGNAQAFDPSGYPYQNYGFNMSTAPGCGNYGPPFGQRDATDRWGYCTRQCVSYAAWAVEASGRSAPMNYGSAASWVGAAPSSIVYRTPEPGDVAISTAGTWGHAMYVEQVDGNRMLVSQYNQQLTGEFSYQWRNWR